jgi:hypothetical protein
MSEDEQVVLLAQLLEHLHLLVDGSVNYNDLELLDGITPRKHCSNY